MLIVLHAGADIIICDEGHVLKNDSSALSKCVNKVQTRRRIVLTGTPLQNNLIECELLLAFCFLLLLHPFNSLFSSTTRVSQHQKGKPL